MIDIQKCKMDYNYLKSVISSGNGEYLLLIEDITRELQLLAINIDGGNIKYIQNPCDEAITKSIAIDPSNIQYIKNPSEKHQCQAIKKNPDVLRLITNPSDSVISIALTQKPSLISTQKIINRNTLKSLLKKDGIIARDINPNGMDEDLWKTAITSQPFAIQYIENPNDELCKIAIEANPFVIKFINNPTKELIKTALHRGSGIIDYINIDHLPDQEQLDLFQYDNTILNKLRNIEYSVWEAKFKDDIINVIRYNPKCVTKMIDCPKHIVRFAVSVCPDIIKYVDNDYDDWLHQTSVNLDYATLNVIGVRTRDIDIHAIKSNPKAIQFIMCPDKEMITLANTLAIIRGINMDGIMDNFDNVDVVEIQRVEVLNE